MKKSDYNNCLALLENLHKRFPRINMGKHINTALDGDDIWSVSDHALSNALHKYTIRMGMDLPDIENIDEIIEQAKHIENILIDDDE